MVCVFCLALSCKMYYNSLVKREVSMTLTSYLETFKKCLDFSGKTGRQECGLFLVHTLLMFFCLDFIDEKVIDIHIPGGKLKLLSTFFLLVVALPLAALLVRRLNDVNKNGWWLATVPASLGVYILNLRFFDFFAVGGWWMPYASYFASLAVVLGTLLWLSFLLFSLDGDGNKLESSPVT